jgi:hypothetical protein
MVTIPSKDLGQVLQLSICLLLVALVPTPFVNQTCFHGVFAPSSKYRIDVTKNQTPTSLMSELK